jgi:hypothetical protein
MAFGLKQLLLQPLELFQLLVLLDVVFVEMKLWLNVLNQKQDFSLMSD